ncbi:MAG TPA: HAD-IIIA family hydrolase [Actinomycetales bacterium]|nr:HAD-IIIA family hydrolase [Actinomycetales bacterium]
MSAAASWGVVVPTLGRPSVRVLLESLAAQQHRPRAVVVVDDRPDAEEPLDVSAYPSALVLRGGGRGPAHARNVGWRALRAPWVVFADDDVVLPPDWSGLLLADLAAAAPDLAGQQARLDVPLPQYRRPTDWERGTAGLAGAAWATAEMAYRREALEAVHGFDERFPRAFREDADLALRVRRAGWRLGRGRRRVVHPVRPSDPWASLRQQWGNADDALMRRLHGRRWHEEAQCPPGRLPWHVATTGAALTAVAGVLTRRRAVATAGAAAWLALTTDFAVRRIAPGPRTRDEVLTMLGTSVAIPPAAVWHRLAGTWRHRAAGPWPLPVRAVLFDRDGTLVEDVPYNGDPALVRPMPGAAQALSALRRAGVRVGVVTNQSAVARGIVTRQQVDAVNERVGELLGPFDTWQVCPHGPDDGCACRKPAPGMVAAAAAELGVRPYEVAVVGDIGSDVDAAHAAGARAVLVPNERTLPAEVEAAPLRAQSLQEAVALLLERPR